MTMVKLRVPVSRQVVQKFKGLLDFYSQNGEHYVRRWPTYTARAQTPGEVMASCHLTAALNKYRCLTEYIRQGYSYRTSGMWWTRRDYFMVHYFGTVDPYSGQAWDHHPPQPSPCPGGGGHYWSLLFSNAIVGPPHHYDLNFWFDQPLQYFLHVRRAPVRFFTQSQIVRGVRCDMGRVGARAGQVEDVFQLSPVSNNKYRIVFHTNPGHPDFGRWYGYITALIPPTTHWALSLSPWFMWEVPQRDILPEEPAPGLTFMFDNIGLPPIAGIPILTTTNVPIGPCLNPSIF